MATNGQVTKAKPPAAKPSASVPTEIGHTGLRHGAGVLAEEYLPVLQGLRGVETYREMTYDPVVGGVLMAIDNMMRRVEWTWEPYSDKAEDRRWAEFCETCTGDMSTSWLDTLSSIFSFLPFGWSYHNIVFKRRNGYQVERIGAPPSSDYDDGLWGWRKWPIRSQDSLVRWDLDDNGGVQGMWQLVATSQSGLVLIPINRALLFRTSSAKESPEGISMFRKAYRPWYFKRRLEEHEAIGAERDLAGMPKIGAPSRIMSPDATPDEALVYQMLQKLVTGVKRNEDEGLVFPNDRDDADNLIYEFELMRSAGARQIDVDKAIARKNQEIAISCLADWLLLGHEGVGSRALGSAKIDVFTAALDTWTDATADVINSHAAPRLLYVNGADPSRSPRLKPGSVTQVDVTEFITACRTAIDGQLIHPGPDDEDRAREILGLGPRSTSFGVEMMPGGGAVADGDGSQDPTMPTAGVTDDQSSARAAGAADATVG